MPEILQIIPPNPTHTSWGLVVFAEGYVAGQRDRFIADARHIFEAIVGQSMWSQWRDRWHLVGIWAESPEEGGWRPGHQVTNLFGATFPTGWRTLTLPDRSRFYRFLSENNLWSVAGSRIILVNDDTFGGSSGSYGLIMSTNSASAEVARHEFGHQFANLADEYDSGSNESEAPYVPNLDTEGDPKRVKWAALIAAGKLGSPVPGDSAGWYRPKFDCKMRSLGADFCPVCVTVLLDTFKQRVGVIEPDPLPDPSAIPLWPPAPVSLSVERMIAA